MDNQFSYSEKEFISKFSKIFKYGTEYTHPTDKPIAYILGGQPGAGKTALQTRIMKSDDNIFIINADAYRKFHPHFQSIQKMYGKDSPKYTQPFINAVTEKLINDLSIQKYNLIVEGTLRTSKVPLQTAQMLKERGYKTELHIMAVKSEISYESTVLRYENAIASEQIPRATAKEHHDLVVSRIPDNLDEIYNTQTFDSIKIFNRDMDCLYSSESSTVSPSVIENEVLNGAYSEEEKNSLSEIIFQTRNLKQSRNASDLSDYTFRTDKLLHQLHIAVYDYRQVSENQLFKLKNTGIPFVAKKIDDKNLIIRFSKHDAPKVRSVLGNERGPRQSTIKR